MMIARALEDLAQTLLEEGKPLPAPAEDAQNRDADLIELVPFVGSRRNGSQVKRHELLKHLPKRMPSGARRRPAYDLLESGEQRETPVPRHNEIDNRLARKICEQLGIGQIR
jgi:hypothetical protein